MKLDKKDFPNAEVFEVVAPVFISINQFRIKVRKSKWAIILFSFDKNWKIFLEKRQTTNNKNWGKTHQNDDCVGRKTRDLQRRPAQKEQTGCSLPWLVFCVWIILFRNIKVNIFVLVAILCVNNTIHEYSGDHIRDQLVPDQPHQPSGRLHWAWLGLHLF